jgi:hypothetical protein
MVGGLALAMTWANGARADSPPPDATVATSQEEEKKPELPSWHEEDGIPFIGVEAYGAGGLAAMNDFRLKSSRDEPDPLRDRAFLLSGSGWMAGGGMRAHLQAPFGLRGGLGIGVFELGGMELTHDPLQAGASVELKRRPMMIDIEPFIGWAFDARYFFPYVEMKVSFDYVSAKLDLSIEGFGHVGTSDYHVWAASVAPRVGAIIPINGEFFVNTSAQWGLTGVQRGVAFVGIGIWDD